MFTKEENKENKFTERNKEKNKNGDQNNKNEWLIFQ